MTNQSPFRYMQPILPVGVGAPTAPYTTWPRGQFAMLARGIKIAFAWTGTPQTSIWVGFNGQAPALFNVGDCFESPVDAKTCEIYNSFGAGATLEVGLVIFDGTYVPQPSVSMFSIGSAFIVPFASNVLHAVPTAHIYPPGTVAFVIDSGTGRLTAYELKTDLTGTPAAGKIVPDDWASNSSMSWYQVL